MYGLLAAQVGRHEISQCGKQYTTGTRERGQDLQATSGTAIILSRRRGKSPAISSTSATVRQEDRRSRNDDFPDLGSY